MHLKFKILSFIILFSGSFTFAQTSSDWNPIGLTVDGKNMQNGIKAFYQLNKCNNEDVVFIKFINDNTNAVVAEWNDAVFTKEHKWVGNEKGDSKKSLTIGGNVIIIGDCSGISHPELVVKIHDFIKNINDFKSFKTTFFQVTVIKK
ncbi:MAG: hypothetical protein HY958_03735 [Bacteroidia bacterium]|nr:hypothetical protein [Bacteroidia bacterium]